MGHNSRNILFVMAKMKSFLIRSCKEEIILRIEASKLSEQCIYHVQGVKEDRIKDQNEKKEVS